MKFPVIGFAALSAALFVVAGCETIENARAAQERNAPAGEEPDVTKDGVATASAAPRIELSGSMLPDYVAFALTNRPDVVQASLAVADAELALKQVEVDGPLVPHLDASGGYSRNTANGRHFTLSHMSGDPSGSLSLDLLVCDFGRNDAQEAEARENLAAALVALLRVRLGVFHEVSAAYFELRMRDALLEAAFTNEFQYASHLKEAQARFEAQEAQKLDVLKAKLDLTDAQLAVITASNAVTTAFADFMKALGVSADETSRDELMPKDRDVVSVAWRELDATHFSAVDGLEIAKGASPELAYLRAKLRAASALVDYRVADLFPELSLGATLSFTDRIWNFGWAFKAVQSVFEGYRRTTAVDRAVVALDSAREDLRLAEQDLSARITSAVATRDNAMKALVAAKVKVGQARENLDVVREEYGVGEASRVEFTDAVQMYTEAVCDRVKAFYSGQAAEAALLTLVGRHPVYVEEKVSAIE